MFKLLKRTALFLVIFLIFVGVFFSNFRGYCKEEGKILSAEELIKKAAGEYYKDNPYCCYVMDGGMLEDDSEKSIDRLFGIHMKRVVTYFRRDGYSEPYYEDNIVVNECGHYLNHYGMSMSEEEYVRAIGYIKRKQKEKYNEKSN